MIFYNAKLMSFTLHTDSISLYYSFNNKHIEHLYFFPVKKTMNPKINNSFYYISLTSVTDVPLESVTVWTLPPLTAM